MEARINGSWPLKQLEEYLSTTITPMRISVNGENHPLLCAVWYHYDVTNQVIRCISHERSLLVKSLRRSPHCSFDISPNSPPYMGVRGRGSVTLKKEGGEQLLTTLMNRHLGGTGSSLAGWLLGRAEQEITIEIEPVSLTSWDYSERMKQ